MRMLLAALILAATLIAPEARAQERVGTAALGALSGALILGPVGAVAGAVVGYTAGPEMARGLGEAPPRARPRRKGQVRPVAKRVNGGASPGSVARPAATTSAAPPPAAKAAPPQEAKAPPAIASTMPAPPVQTFD